MSQGSLDPQRAVGGALVGLAVQALAMGVLAGTGLYSGEPALASAAWLSGGGLVVWIVLALFFYQQRLVRLEAHEAERFSRQGEADGGLFQRSAAELSLAKRRLDAFIRWVLPGAALWLGLWLSGAGAWLSWRNAAFLPQREEVLTLGFDALFAAAFCAGLALAGFLASRYLAGLARHASWEPLRGGASILMASVAASALLTVGLLVARYATPAFLRYLAIIVPGLFALVGLEMLVNLVLGVYRPRQAGEMPRLAFDTRLLEMLLNAEGFAATFTEAMHYQFGFEITRSWFWKLMGRAVAPLLGFAIVSLLALSCLVYVRPHEQALVTVFGRLSGQALAPGLHLKWPWPIASSEVFDVARVREFRVGSQEAPKPGVPVLWTNEHAEGEEGLLIMAAPRQQAGAGRPQSGGRGAPDVGLMVAEVPVQYRIRDLPAFATRSSGAHAEEILRSVARSEVTRFFLGLDEDQVLGPKRIETGERLRTRLQEVADAEGLGVEIVFAGIVGAHPHPEVARAWHETVRAMQEKETLIEEARREAIRIYAQAAGSEAQAREVLAAFEKREHLREQGAPESVIRDQEARIEHLLRGASGLAAQELLKAEAERWQTENAERGRAEVFQKKALAQQKAPRYFRAQSWLDVLAETLPQPRKVVVASERRDLTVRMDLKDQDAYVPLNLDVDKP